MSIRCWGWNAFSAIPDTVHTLGPIREEWKQAWWLGEGVALRHTQLGLGESWGLEGDTENCPLDKRFIGRRRQEDGTERGFLSYGPMRKWEGAEAYS